jgi:hypothetical protein
MKKARMNGYGERNQDRRNRRRKNTSRGSYRGRCFLAAFGAAVAARRDRRMDVVGSPSAWGRDDTSARCRKMQDWKVRMNRRKTEDAQGFEGSYRDVCKEHNCHDDDY